MALGIRRWHAREAKDPAVPFSEELCIVGIQGEPSKYLDSGLSRTSACSCGLPGPVDRYTGEEVRGRGEKDWRRHQDLLLESCSLHWQ